MKESTRNEYISLAIHFESTVKAKLNVDSPAPSDYIKELILRSESTTPAYWRRLRNALKVRCEDQGFTKYAKKYAELKNPLTEKGIKTDGMKRRNKLKNISQDDFNLLRDNAKNESTKAMMNIVNLTGCRPSEVANMALGFGAVTIHSTKKDAANTRGLDREIRFNNLDDFTLLVESLEVIRAESKTRNIEMSKLIGLIQDRFDKLAKKTFPERKGLCLYTLRHQYGSNLKASGLSRKEQAYIMGHRVTKSLNEYGSKRWGKSAVSVEAAQSFDHVVENHNDVTNENRKEMMQSKAKSQSKASSFDYSTR